MTVEELLELFDTFSASVFRLETFQTYVNVGDEDRQRAFHNGQPLPPPSKSKQETLRWIEHSTKAGKRIHRAHIVDLPLTPYMRYELAVYRENTAAGEGVFIADRSAHPDLAGLNEDFCLFDEETEAPTVVWFRYEANGELLGYDRADDPAAIAQCRRQRDLVLAHAVDLESFAASTNADP